MGLLIHTASGRRGGWGGLPTNRSGWAAKAASSTAPRARVICSARPRWTSAGVSSAIPLLRCSQLYQPKNRRQNARASWMQPNRSGKAGWCLRVLNWLSL